MHGNFGVAQQKPISRAYIWDEGKLRNSLPFWIQIWVVPFHFTFFCVSIVAHTPYQWWYELTLIALFSAQLWQQQWDENLQYNSDAEHNFPSHNEFESAKVFYQYLGLFLTFFSDKYNSMGRWNISWKGNLRFSSLRLRPNFKKSSLVFDNHDQRLL